MDFLRRAMNGTLKASLSWLILPVVLSLSCSKDENDSLEKSDSRPIRETSDMERDNMKRAGIDWLNSKQEFLTEIADKIWKNPEVAHNEFQTSDLLTKKLSNAGFTLERDVAQLPTAFVASYGSSRPTIGIVALLDALPAMSQKNLATQRESSTPGTPGHGCGHNLICAADLGASLAIKTILESYDLSGTIKLFGVPAEEIYHGGVYMVRSGIFDDLDIILFWHPSSVTTVITRSGLAMNSVRFVFRGLFSDATDAAELGRNALQAAEKMIDEVNQMKDELPEHAVVNHVITKGGETPSVIPELAEVWYFIHARDRERVTRLSQKISEAAKRAAQKTGTRLEIQFLSGTNHWLINHSLAHLIYQNLIAGDKLVYTSEEKQYSAVLQRSFNQEGLEPIFSVVLPLDFSEAPVHISDDTAEASWVAPRGGFLIACFPKGLASHTWQWTAAATSSIAHKGMMRAAETLVRTSIDLLTNPDELLKIKKEFAGHLKGHKYQSPIPPEQGPFEYLQRPER